MCIFLYAGCPCPSPSRQASPLSPEAIISLTTPTLPCPPLLSTHLSAHPIPFHPNSYLCFPRHSTSHIYLIPISYLCGNYTETKSMNSLYQLPTPSYLASPHVCRPDPEFQLASNRRIWTHPFSHIFHISTMLNSNPGWAFRPGAVNEISHAKGLLYFASCRRFGMD